MAGGDLSFSGRARALGVARARQAWTIAKVELRRAFFAKRALWVYGLALLPALIFFGHGLDVKLRGERLARRGLAQPALMDSIREGEAVDGREEAGRHAGPRNLVGAEQARPEEHRECGGDHPCHRAGR